MISKWLGFTSVLIAALGASAHADYSLTDNGRPLTCEGTGTHIGIDASRTTAWGNLSDGRTFNLKLAKADTDHSTYAVFISRPEAEFYLVFSDDGDYVQPTYEGKTPIDCR